MSLHGLRAALVEAVPEQATGYDHVPARVTVPAAIITPGLPYIEPGDTFGSFTVRHVMSLVAQTGANDRVTQEADDLLEDTLVSLLNAGHSVAEVGPHYVYDSNNTQYLAQDVTVLTPFRP